MGYSCTAKAGFTLNACMKIAGDKESSNVFRGHFYEQGRENPDGAITAQVMVWLPDGLHCKPSGSIRIEADGKITRFPTMTKAEKAQAEKAAKKEFDRIYPNW